MGIFAMSQNLIRIMNIWITALCIAEVKIHFSEVLPISFVEFTQPEFSEFGEMFLCGLFSVAYVNYRTNKTNNQNNKGTILTNVFSFTFIHL